MAGAYDSERYFSKVRLYLSDRSDTLSLRKVYNNSPLTGADLDDIQRLVHEAAAGTVEDEEPAAREAGGFGVFARSLIGLDRNAAKEAFADFLDDKQFNATQIEFINLVIDHLVVNGTVPTSRCTRAPSLTSAPPAPTVSSPPPKSTK